MDFQLIPKVEKDTFYLKVALDAGDKEANIQRGKKTPKDGLQKAINIESKRILMIRNTLAKPLQKIANKFPQYDIMSEFYQELFKCYFEPKDLNDALMKIKEISNQIFDITNKYLDKTKGSNTKEGTLNCKREYQGRIKVLIKRISKDLDNLEKIRKLLRSMPTIKDNMPTVCICGFPNVGKTTLLTKLTPSKAEIAAYAFTTTGLNTGYLTYNARTIQFIDTPGTLNRPEKMNLIEKQAYLAAKLCADVIVYVFDLTEGYPLADQIRLYDVIKKYKKPLMVYLSKTDILDKKLIDNFVKGYVKIDIYDDVEKLKEELIKKI